MMNPVRTMLGFLVIGIGVIFLGNNLNWWGYDVWNIAWHFWPLILILIGVSLLVRNAALSLIIMLAIIVAIGVMVARGYIPKERLSSRYDTAQSSFNQEVDTSDAQELAIRMGGNIKLKIDASESATTVKAALSGPKAWVDTVSLSKEGDKIVLKEDFPTFHGPFVGDWRQVEGTLTIPRSIGLKMDVSGLYSSDITGHNGPVQVDGSGSTTLTFRSSTSLDPSIELSGAGKVALDQCQGQAEIKLSGAGKVMAQNCTLSRLRVEGSGASEVEITGGTLTDFSADVSGASKIRVPKPSGKNERETSGAANISFIE